MKNSRKKIKRGPGRSNNLSGPPKRGGCLLSQLVCQYHRR